MTHAHDFLQRLQSRLAGLSWITHRFKESRDRLINGLGSHVVLGSVECLSGSSSDRGILVDERLSDRGDDLIFVIRQDVLVGRGPECQLMTHQLLT